VDAACHAYSMISVPLYDTLGPDTVRYICNHAELAAVACSVEVLGKMLEVLHECPTVRLLVSTLPTDPPWVHLWLVAHRPIMWR